MSRSQHPRSRRTTSSPANVLARDRSGPEDYWKSVRNFVLAAVVLYAFICTFPIQFEPLQSGLDGSWMYAINRLATSATDGIGRNVAFTYGPWGFVLEPREVGNGTTLIASCVVWTGLHIALFYLAVGCFRKHASRLVTFCAGYFVLNAFGPSEEQRLLFVVGVLGLLSIRKSSSTMLWAALSGVLAAACLFLKFNLGISAICVVATSWIVVSQDFTPAGRRKLVVGIASLALSGLTFGLLCCGSLKNLWRWLGTSGEIARGYSAAMSIQGGWIPLALAALDLLILIALWYGLAPATRRGFWLFVPGIYFAFKEGFVRQDNHRTTYFIAMATIPVLLLVCEPTKKEVWRTALCFLLLTGTTLAYGSSYVSLPGRPIDDVRSVASKETGIGAISKLLQIKETRAALRAAATENLRADYLPETWREHFATARATVSILPSELSIAAANRMDWRPIVPLQLYSAYTQSLDAAAAAALRNQGPDELIVQYDGIDGRNPVLDTPETWRTVLQNYRVRDVSLRGRRALLEREQLRPETIQELSGGRASLNEWIGVPRTQFVEYAALDVGPTVAGALTDILYQLPPLNIELIRTSGRFSRFRIISRTAINGVLINYLPESEFELEKLVEGRANDAVVRFRLVAPASAWLFRQQYTWRLLRSDRSISPAEAKPAQSMSEVKLEPGSGRPAVVVVSVADPNGVRDLRLLQVLVNHGLDGAHACYVSYDVADDRLWLMSDGGQGSAGSGHPGDHVILSNSQCSIALEHAESTLEEKTMSLRIPIALEHSFTGVQHVYVSEIDVSGLRTDWIDRGGWQAK